MKFYQNAAEIAPKNSKILRGYPIPKFRPISVYFSKLNAQNSTPFFIFGGEFSSFIHNL